MSFALEVLPIGFVAVGARVWRNRGHRLLTAIVKITCSLQPDGPMALVAPAPIADKERHFMGNPVASLVRASDLALLVPRPEVVVVGSAHAAPGQMATQLSVRLAVQRDSTTLITKRLDIVGDRRAAAGHEPPSPKQFSRMPIVYERALGGMTSRDNPVGVGLEPDPDGLITLPNISAQSAALPHGLGPIPSAWPVRARCRGSLPWAQANLTSDVEVPPDFDDNYFQTAPPDQQTTELRGGDLLAIVNMHPEIGMLRTTLPMGRAVAVAQNHKGDRYSFQLRIDTVHIEPDTMRAEIVYRGAIVAQAENDFDGVRIAGAFEPPDKPFTFPDLSTLEGLLSRGPISQSSPPPGGSQPALDSTEVFEQGDHPPVMQPMEVSYGIVDKRMSGTLVMENAPPRPVYDEPPPAQRIAIIVDPAPTFGPPPSALINALRSGAELPKPRQNTAEMTLDASPAESLPFRESNAPIIDLIRREDDDDVKRPRTGTLEIIADGPTTLNMARVDPAKESTVKVAPIEPLPAKEPKVEPIKEEPPVRAPVARADSEPPAAPKADPYNAHGQSDTSAPIMPAAAPSPRPKVERVNVRSALYKKR